MPQWINNAPFQVFHGTDDVSAAALAAVGVSLALCRPNTDFGQGFYVTTSLHQARQWANTRVLRSPRRLIATVVSFGLDRDWLAGLDTLAFVRPIKDFWDLVTDCRYGFPPHQRSPPHPRPYDVVYGPVTIWPQRLIIADCEQISFHTRRAVVGMGPPSIFEDALTSVGNVLF